MLYFKNGRTGRMNVPVDIYGKCTPLWYACQYSVRGIDKVKTLIAEGADPNIGIIGTTGNSPLMVACRQRGWRCVKILLESGADPNQADSWGETPLLVACEWQSYECVKLLVDSGADIYHTFNVYNEVITPIKATRSLNLNFKQDRKKIINLIHSKRYEFEKWLYKIIQLPTDMIKEIHSFL